jgi:hypothetical protein
MAVLEDDMQAQASVPLITAVERVEVVAPLSLPEGYGLNVTTENGHGEVVVVSACPALVFFSWLRSARFVLQRRTTGISAGLCWFDLAFAGRIQNAQ